MLLLFAVTVTAAIANVVIDDNDPVVVAIDNIVVPAYVDFLDVVIVAAAIANVVTDDDDPVVITIANIVVASVANAVADDIDPVDVVAIAYIVVDADGLVVSACLVAVGEANIDVVAVAFLVLLMFVLVADDFFILTLS